MRNRLTLVLISGAGGSLGYAGVQAASQLLNTQVIAISRKKIQLKDKKIKNWEVDLLDERSTAKKIEKEDFQRFSRIIFIHAVGKFKFEETGKPVLDHDSDGIDDDVFDSNVKTFQNVVAPLLHEVKKIAQHPPVTLCAFGSISDRYNVPYWQSYSKSKNQLRQYMRKLTEKGKINALFVNVSTTKTDRERNLRPRANQAYWLKPTEIVEQLFFAIWPLNVKWKEIGIYKPCPHYTPDYFTNHQAILKKWKKEMGKS